MFRYIKLTYNLCKIFINYIIIDKNNEYDCEKFYNNFLKLGTIPVKLCQWIVNYSYHLSNNKKSLLFTTFYKKIMNNCQYHDINYTHDIFKKYNIQVTDLKVINSGSVGQIYKGLWNDKIVAIKVLHPEINYTTDYWIFVLRIIFFILKITNILKKLNLEWQSIKTYFTSQFDFRMEGKNLEIFYDYYFNNNYIIIPKPYFYEKDLLIMDYIESYNLDKIEESYSNYTLYKIYNFMSIILDDMFDNSSYLHGDFHNGNYGIIIDNNSFKVVLYDFGLIVPNSVDISLLFCTPMFKESDICTESFMNVFRIDKKFYLIIKDLINKDSEQGNIDFNEIIKIVIENDGDIQISLETIFLISTFLNIKKLKKIDTRNIIDKISLLEEFNCFEKYYENLVSYFFEDDKTCLKRENIYEKLKL